MTPVVSAEIAWKGQDLARCMGRCSCPIPSRVVPSLFERKVPNKSNNTACLLQCRRLSIVRIESELKAAVRHA
jgi:hypothetical protein